MSFPRAEVHTYVPGFGSAPAEAGALLNVEAFQGLGVGWLREVYAAAERVFLPTAWPLAPGC